MSTPRINPLPFMRHILTTMAPDTWGQFGRSELFHEAFEFCRNHPSLLSDGLDYNQATELLTDACLAAGIGDTDQQNQTVYCTVSYGD